MRCLLKRHGNEHLAPVYTRPSSVLYCRILNTFEKCPCFNVTRSHSVYVQTQFATTNPLGVPKIVRCAKSCCAKVRPTAREYPIALKAVGLMQGFVIANNACLGERLPCFTRGKEFSLVYGGVWTSPSFLCCAEQ